MQIARYRLSSKYPNVGFTAAIVADLHDRPFDAVLKVLEQERPDIILIPGDLCEWLSEPFGEYPRHGLELLPQATAIAPTFYSLGNHEIGAKHENLRHAEDIEPSRRTLHPDYIQWIKTQGVTLLDGSWVTWNGISIGGLGSGLWNADRAPDLSWIKDFEAQDGYKLLLCHHPEYYARHLKDTDIDLIVSGHAHGGQWRIFGRGVYAPDQHLFPKYTSGVHDGRLVISRGVANSVYPIPRFFNPCQVVMVTVVPQTIP